LEYARLRCLAVASRIWLRRLCLRIAVIIDLGGLGGGAHRQYRR